MTQAKAIGELDAIHRLAVTAAEAASGVRRSVRFHGADGVQRQIPVDVPAGAATGLRIPVPGSEQWSWGRLVVEIVVLPHQQSTVRGDTLQIDLEADRATALRDGQVEAPLSDGSIARIPVYPGMWDGMFVFIGHGLPRTHDASRRGDLVIRLRLIETDTAAGPGQTHEPPARPWWRTLLGRDASAVEG
jgi:DnaJ-class molecular chaperone